MKLRLGRRPLPADVVLDTEELVLARAPIPSDMPASPESAAEGGEVVVTSRGLWLPGAGRIGWHLISRVTWDAGTLGLVVAHETGTVGGAVLLADEPVRRVRLPEPGKVPEIVRRRVEDSIRSRHRRELPGGGAWFVQRAVPGQDGIVLQVRPDPGTDDGAVAQVVEAVAGALVRGSQPPPTA